MRSHTDNSATIPQQSRIKKANQKKSQHFFWMKFFTFFPVRCSKKKLFWLFLLFMVFQTNRMINSSCAVTLQFVWKKITKRKFLHFWDYWTESWNGGDGVQEINYNLVWRNCEHFLLRSVTLSELIGANILAISLSF